MTTAPALRHRPSLGELGRALRVAWRSGLLGALRPAGMRALGRIMRDNPSPAAMYSLHAANSPDKIALVAGNRRFTFRELDLRINRLAGALKRLGIGRGGSALVMLRNRPEFLEIQAAMTRIGGAAVSVSWRSTPAELAFLAEDSGAKVLFFDSEVWPTVEQCDSLGGIVREAPGGRGGLVAVGGANAAYEALIDGSTALDEAEANAGGAVVIYTSGTTGRPKGAVRKFPPKTIQAVLGFIGQTPMRHDDRHLAVCPLYHSAAFGFIGMTYVLGGTVVLSEHFEPEEFLRLVDRESITTTTLVPTMLYRVLALPPEVRRRYRTASLRAIFSGAAPLPPTLALRVLDAFGPVLYNFYGSTETGLVTLAGPEELGRHPDTIGAALPLNDIRLFDEAGAEVGPNEVGELYVQNPLLVSGYHGDETATRAARRGEYFSVGDLARRDGEGLYYIEGRKRDMIISGGVNVYPAEVENALTRHPSVREAAVVGVEDPEWGERVRAFVALHEGTVATAEEIVSFCRTELGGAKVPREVVILPELPRNPTGKVLKRELRDWKPA